MVPSSIVKTSRACPISNCKDAFLVAEKDRHGAPLRNVMGKDSGLIFVDPVPFENTEEFYKTEYRKSYKGVHRPKPKHIYRAGLVALERYERIKNFISKDAACLDAGSSSGEFVYLLKSRGYRAEGAEANEPYAEYSRSELDISVSILPFSKFKEEQQFDLITMFHVLEHLEHPIRDLTHLAKCLKPNGKFVIEVPNILYSDMAFSHKWHPGHLFSYTKNTLPLLMMKAGLETISCSPIGDGGNLWGVFQKWGGQPNSCSGSTNFDPSDDLRALRRGARSYYLNPKNYLKFIPKTLKQLREKPESRLRSGIEILDELYRND